MWHEARKQERMIRGLIVDYRRRAERRKDFYEKIKAEPTQFLQLHGRPCKIHLDPMVAAAGEGPAIMMPWQGDANNMIDRFDVRAHLDYIPEVKYPYIPPEDLSTEERQCNYESYRILAQNAFLGISEDKFLQQLAIEEQFGVTIDEKESQKEKLHERKGTGAAIGYNYNDPGAQPSCSNGPEPKKVEQKDSDDELDLEIIDVDLSIDVNKMEASQAHELNAVGPQFGMAGCDLFSFLTGDADDAEHQKQLLREEKEKAMFSGRKSRRERRAHRDKRLATRVASPPHYAARDAPSAPSPVPSRSPSPPAPLGDIQFITSFGDDDDVKQPQSKPLYAEKVKQNMKKSELLYADVARKPQSRFKCEESPRPVMGPRGPNSRSRSRSTSRFRSRSLSPSWKKSRSKSRSYSRSRSATSRSRSRSYSPSRRSRSRSRSRPYRSRRSRSPANNSAYSKRNKSRSLSCESDDRIGVSKPVVPRYYGRRKEDKSSSELSLDSDSSESADDSTKKSAVGNKSNTNQNQFRLSGSSSKGPSRETLSLKEKLKRKMQAQLSRQLRADKRAEAERVERERGRRARRDEDMRQLAIKLRRKQREMRHQQCRRSSDDNSDKSRSGSSSRDSPPPETRDERSRSKSKSPKDKRIPVWEINREPTTAAAFRPQPPPDYGTTYYTEPPPNQYEEPVESYYKEQKRPDDIEARQQYPRYDRYPSREYGIRYDSRFEPNQGHETRWEQDRGYQTRRRPFGYRGPSFRSQVPRQGPPDMGYGEGPSNWNPRNTPYTYNRETSEGSQKNKIKLVDY